MIWRDKVDRCRKADISQTSASFIAYRQLFRRRRATMKLFSPGLNAAAAAAAAAPGPGVAGQQERGSPGRTPRRQRCELIWLHSGQ